MEVKSTIPLLSPVDSAVKPAASSPTQRDSPAKIHKAAQEFEALLIGQMLKSVRESSFGGGWGTTDQSGDVALEMAEQQMSQLLASNGGLGLAQMISKGLQSRVTATSTIQSAHGASKP